MYEKHVKKFFIQLRKELKNSSSLHSMMMENQQSNVTIEFVRNLNVFKCAAVAAVAAVEVEGSCRMQRFLFNFKTPSGVCSTHHHVVSVLFDPDMQKERE